MQGGEGPHLVANAAFLAEKTAREAAESKLATLRRSLAHKDELVKALKTKVCSLCHQRGSAGPEHPHVAFCSPLVCQRKLVLLLLFAGITNEGCGPKHTHPAFC